MDEEKQTCHHSVLHSDHLKAFFPFVNISLRTINRRRRDILYFSIFYILPDVCTLEQEAVTSL